MSVGAWCGYCGQSFRLAEVVDSGAPGACPRCGRVYTATYRTVVVAEVRRLLSAAAALRDPTRQLRDPAPELHVDAGQLGPDVDADQRG